MPSFADAFAGSFPGVITFEWVPDPKVVAKEIIQVAEYLEDMQPPLRAAKAIGQADYRERFATNSGPNGEEWAPLDDEYQLKKASMGGDPSDPLTLTGALEDAGASDSAWLVGAREVFFNTGALPFYGMIHQEGSGAEQAGMAAFGRASIRARRGEISGEGGEHSSQDIGRGKALPARPFIGISADAEYEIFEVFDIWFAAGTQISISGAGTVQQRIGGKFGPKLYPNLGRL